jgi:hypothetical protein
MPNDLSSINLARDKQVPLFDKFMNWTLTIGRLIVILTEIIAIVAFVYRFSLDEKLVELHSSIRQKQNIISILKNDENKYRNLQERIALAATFSTKGIKTNRAITDIISLIPNQVMINNLILNKDQINIDADVISVSSLANLIDPLKNYPGIKSISVDNIENKPSAGLSVDITAMLK